MWVRKDRTGFRVAPSWDPWYRAWDLLPFRTFLALADGELQCAREFWDLVFLILGLGFRVGVLWGVGQNASRVWSL